MKVVEFEALVDVLAERGAKARHITAVAGPPGSGKSTLADRLAEALNEREPGSAAVFPMDGYHFDDVVLNARGWRARKGAPHTFDVGGFAAMLSRLRADEEDEIAVPVFDRSIEIARNAARFIPRSVRHLIVEGNYLLLNEAPWTDLSFDTTVYLQVPIEELERRLSDRWQALTGETLREKMEDNDLPNARHVVEHSRPAEFVVRNF
ncbi:MAG: AAA family ATPase [Silicimonas sp.]|jgi:pantothenate kinase|nr:AAA family ATPase [Silicimonas sp.]